MLKLVIIDDEGRKTPVPLLRSEITIGRGEGNTIRLTERNVSRHHARLARGDDGFRIEDLSRYGVKKNGRRVVGEAAFEEGDILFIGDYRLTLVVDETVSPPVEPEEASKPALERRAITADLELDDESEASSEPDLTELDAAEAVTAVSNRARLVCLTDPFVGSEFVFMGDLLVIGTADDCDLIIEHPTIAAYHARFVRDGEGYRVEPVGESPVRVENRAVGEVLHGRDVVRLGELAFRYVEGGEPVHAAPVAASYSGEPERSGFPWWWGIVAALVLIGAAFALSRGGGASVSDAPDSGAVVVEPTAFERGQQAMRAGDWDAAIAAFGAVSALSDDKEAARGLLRRAEEEKANEAPYRTAVAELEGSGFAAALDAVRAIPAGSYYAARAQDEQLGRRAQDGLAEAALAASRESEAADDWDAALAVVVEAQAVAPQHRGLANRIEQLRARATALAVAEPEVEEEVEAAAEAPPRTSPRATPRRPSRTEEPAAPPVARVTPPAEPTVDERAARAERADMLRRQAARSAVQQNFRDAILLLEQARELNPVDPRIDLMLFNNYRQVGNANRASGAVRRYLRAQPNDPRRAEFEAWLAENAPE